jgi:hypothetical protein
MNIKIFCRCSLFPSCRAKDLLPPLYKQGGGKNVTQHVADGKRICAMHLTLLCHVCPVVALLRNWLYMG